jgi:acyl-CoA reductase-like NAD-dependent aldehyde dehydrogenase
MTQTTEISTGPSVGPLPTPGFKPKPATPEREIDRAVERLREHAREFARTPIGTKIEWLNDIAHRLVDVAPQWVLEACRAKGIDPDSPMSGEEWLGGPAVTVRNIRLLIEALRQIVDAGVPKVESQDILDLPNGRIAVRAIPHGSLDKAVLGGFTCDVWMNDGVDRAKLPGTQASFYKTKDPEGGVSLVLGAGNVASIPPMDAIYKMFVDGNVCILKMNPVNEYLGPFLERAFQTLIDRGFLAIVYGGGEVGAYLCQHRLVDDIHITGSDKTHDLIVWGPPGPEREDRKRRKDPLLKKKITSELGNVSPVVVVPGPYSDDELGFMADNVAGMVMNNASFNCNAAKLLVLPKGFDKKAQFLEKIAAAMAKVPPRKAYYPGAKDRFSSLTEGEPRVQKIGDAAGEALPWTLVTDLDAGANPKHFHVEPFCSILSQTEIGSTDPIEFIDAAVAFCNDKVWGTLNAMMFVHPRHESDPGIKPAVEAAIRDLRYGTVAINHWPAMVYAFGAPPWGGHPSATLENIQSGLGWVHNTLMFEDIEKSVLRGPLKVFPKPAWFPGHKTLHHVGRKLTHLELEPSWLKVPSIAFSAIRA